MPWREQTRRSFPSNTMPSCDALQVAPTFGAAFVVAVLASAGETVPISAANKPTATDLNAGREDAGRITRHCSCEVDADTKRCEDDPS